MGRELTRRHSSLFQKRVTNPVTFVSDIYRYGKFRELVSFVVWELLHQLRLFPKDRYLAFSTGEPLALTDKNLNALDFDQQIQLFFRSKGLSAERLDQDWKLLVISDGEIFGAIYPDDTVLYKSSDGGKSVTVLKKFPESIKSIFVSSQGLIFVCVKGAVYRSADRGHSFQMSLELGSPISYFRHNNSMTETPEGVLLIGEYGNIWEGSGWRKLAYLYISCDGGQSWETSDFLIQEGINKHVHLVKYSREFDKLFMADGDNYKKLWVSEPPDRDNRMRFQPMWKAVNRFHIQKGGYTSVVESNGRILFGTDYQGGTNFVVETTDGETYTSKIIPDPYRRSPINNMVIRKSGHLHEIWASLPHSTNRTKCLLMYSADDGETWHRVIEYQKGLHNVSLISASDEAADALYFSIKNLRNGDSLVYKIADRKSNE